MKKYEIMYIVPSKYTEGEMDGIIKKVSGVMQAAGAVVADTHNLGKRRLAYAIDGQRNGTYTLTYFEAEPTSVAKLDEVLRLTNEILRHMIVERDMHIKQVPHLIDLEERKFDEPREHVKMAAAPVVKLEPVVKPVAINMEELDKKLDEILTEEVL